MRLRLLLIPATLFFAAAIIKFAHHNYLGSALCFTAALCFTVSARRVP